MKLKIYHTRQFDRDVKRQKKRGKDLQKLKKVTDMLENDDNLPHIYKSHKLTGNYKNRLECHIEPDWLLIYKKIKNELIFERTGSHSDLF